VNDVLKYEIFGTEGFAGWRNISTFPGSEITRSQFNKTWKWLFKRGYVDTPRPPPGSGSWEVEYIDPYGGVNYAVLTKRKV
jgi:hypothetical protein